MGCETSVQRDNVTTSCLLPLFQNESKCETIRIEMCSSYRFIFMQTHFH